MWESLAIRQLGVLENAGSNPAILTEGRANWHDGTRSEAGRGESPCRFESCPFRLLEGSEEKSSHEGHEEHQERKKKKRKI